MKHVVGISLGSSRRDHSVTVNLLGEECKVERFGSDGDMRRMIELIKEYDGKVDAFGLGGIDLYVSAVDKRYILRDAKKITRAAKLTPIVDGSGLKHTLERRVIEYLAANTDIFKERRRASNLCHGPAGDGPGAVRAGCDVTLGDFLYILNVPLPLKSLKPGSFGRILAPIVVQLPFSMIYPTGEKQENKPRQARYFLKTILLQETFIYTPLYAPGSRQDSDHHTVTRDDVCYPKELGKDPGGNTPEMEGRFRHQYGSSLALWRAATRNSPKINMTGCWKIQNSPPHRGASNSQVICQERIDTPW